MIYVVENGSPAPVTELHSVSGGTPEEIDELYLVTNGTPELIWSSEFAAPIMGAPGETVTYTGPVSGSVTLDGNGDAAPELRPGVYTFVGSISGTRSNVRVSRGAPVTMWPEGARILYWYGRFGLLDNGTTPQSYEKRIASGAFSGGDVAENTNSLRLNAYGRAYQGSHAGLICIHFEEISYTGYTHLVYVVSGREVTTFGGHRSQLGQKDEISTTEPPESFTADGTYTYSIDPDKRYICASAYENGSNESGTHTLYYLDAVYLT